MTRAIWFALFLTLSPVHAMDYSVETAKTSSGREINLVRAVGIVNLPNPMFGFKNNDLFGWLRAVQEIDRSRDTLIVLWSPGGQFKVGMMLAQRLSEFADEQADRQKKVGVLVEHGCLSVCVPLF